MAMLHVFSWERNLSSLAHLTSHYNDIVGVEALETQTSMFDFFATVKI